MQESKKRNIFGEIFFRLSRAYVRFWHDLVYYKRIYLLGKGNVPPKGTPLIVASNHQNALNDALAVEFSMTDRPVSIFTRADLFQKRFVGGLLRSWYLLPAFRLGMDGADALGKNFDVFAEAGERILEGGSVMIFPEAVNQDKRWLGEFSQGYLRMAFDAAKKSDFKTDIQILPMINHYSDYFHFREQMLVKFGKPISLMPYYEQYQTKPRTVQRNLNALVRSQIDDMMLNITDLDNYEAIDYLRETYGMKYCGDCGGNPDNLPDKLMSDKAFVKELMQAVSEDESLRDSIYKDALMLKAACGEQRIGKVMYQKQLGGGQIALRILGLVSGFPIMLAGLVPNLILLFAPTPITNKLKAGDSHGAMFIGGVRFALNALVVIPVTYTAVFVTEGCLYSWLYAAIHTLCLPLLGLFAWGYRMMYMDLRRHLRFRNLKDKALKAAVDVKNKLFDKLDNILNKNTWKKE